MSYLFIYCFLKIIILTAALPKIILKILNIPDYPESHGIHFGNLCSCSVFVIIFVSDLI